MKITRICAGAILAVLPALAVAHVPAGPKVTTGSLTPGDPVSPYAGGNLASPAASAALQERARSGAAFWAAGGLEYGNVDDIFEIINTVSAILDENDDDQEQTPPPTPPPEGLPGIPEHLPSNPSWRELLEASPQFQEWYEGVKSQATFIAAALAIISEEAYARAYYDFAVPVLISNTLWGGSLALDFSSSRTSRAVGILDSFEFDAEQALQQIEAAKALDPNAPETEFNLSDDILLIVDPGQDRVQIRFDNESLLLTKSARVDKFTLAYSREFINTDAGKGYWGLGGNFYRIGLSQVNTRFGDITDAEELFNDIRHASYDYSSDFSFDYSLLWLGDGYSLGATLSNLFAPEFNFPESGVDNYRKTNTLRKLKRELSYSPDTQLRLEATTGLGLKNWSGSLVLDTNASQTPMGDKYQWLVAGASYNHPKPWVPDLRLGYRKNLVGNELSFVGLGISLFDIVSLDLASSLQSIKIDGTHVPRGAHLSVGFQFEF